MNCTDNLEVTEDVSGIKCVPDAPQQVLSIVLDVTPNCIYRFVVKCRTLTPHAPSGRTILIIGDLYKGKDAAQQKPRELVAHFKSPAKQSQLEFGILINDPILITAFTVQDYREKTTVYEWSAPVPPQPSRTHAPPPRPSTPPPQSLEPTEPTEPTEPVQSVIITASEPSLINLETMTLFEEDALINLDLELLTSDDDDDDDDECESNGDNTDGINFAGTSFQITGALEHSQEDNSFTFTSANNIPNAGILTTYKSRPNTKYLVEIEGTSSFKSSQGSLYLWVGSEDRHKMLYFKPIAFNQDAVTILTIPIYNTQYRKLRVELYFRGRPAPGENFVIKNIEFKRETDPNSSLSSHQPDILIIGDFATMLNSVATSRYDMLQYLCKNNPHVHLFGTDHPRYRENISIYNVINLLGIHPQIIIHMMYHVDTLLVSQLSNYRCKTKALLLEDMHDSLNITRAAKNAGINALMYTCDCAELDVIRENLNTIGINPIYSQIPHAIDVKTYRNYGESKIYDVIFYGTPSRDYYPFRHRLYTLLQSDQAKRLRVKIVPFTGYIGEQVKQMPRGEELARLINSAWIGISTRSRVDYFVKKYLEIPACGTMVAGNIPTRGEGHSLLKGNMIELREEMTDTEIIGTLLAALEDKRELMRRTQMLSAMVHTNYSFEAVYRRFMDAI